MVVILTAKEILCDGLLLCGFDVRRQKDIWNANNLRRFKSHYGSDPVVCMAIWEALLTTKIPEARISDKAADIDLFLMSSHFLYRYSTEEQRAGLFKICETTARNWGWYYVNKIAALKGEKVSCKC